MYQPVSLYEEKMTNKTKGEATRSRVIKAARSLVNRKGFSNTSINDIIRVTGVKKGNLYFHFASKEELGQAILNDAAEEFFEFLSNSFKGEKPLDRLSYFFDEVFEKHKKTNFTGGCIFGNTALEISDNNSILSDLLKKVFSKWINVITDILIEAEQYEQLSTKAPPSVLAKHIVASIEGGIMMVRLTKNENDLKDCLDSLRILLKKEK